MNLIRYADDFVITGRTKELLEGEIKLLVEQFLHERGLELSPAKTVITHVEKGFDFLLHSSTFPAPLVKLHRFFDCRPQKVNGFVSLRVFIRSFALPAHKQFCQFPGVLLPANLLSNKIETVRGAGRSPCHLRSKKTKTSKSGFEIGSPQASKIVHRFKTHYAKRRPAQTCKNHLTMHSCLLRNDGPYPAGTSHEE